MSVKRLSPEGGVHEVVYQQGRWAPKDGGLGGPTSIGEGNKCSEDAGPRRGVD